MTRIYHLIFALIIILAALLRFIGTNPGYPPTHTDEGITHSQGIAMILERTLDPKHGYGVPYNYPIIVPLVNAFFYLFFFIPVYLVGYLILHFGELSLFLKNSGLWAGIFDQNILGPGRINVVFWGRYVTAFFGVGVVVISYFLGKRLFKSAAIGLLASFFVAINYRQVLNSHIGLPDIYNAFFLLVALYQIVRLWEKQTLMRFLWAGFFIAVFFSTKFQFFALPPLGLVLIFIAFKEKKWKKRLAFFFHTHILLLLSVTVITAAVLSIFHIIHWRETLEQVGYSALKYRYGRMELDFYPLSYLYHVGVGPLMSLMVIGGVILGLIFRFCRMLFLLSVIIPFFWMFAYFTGGGFYTRNFVTIIPLLLICSSFGIYQLWKFIRQFSPFLSLILISSVLALISYESLKNSLVVPIEYSKPWNYKLLQNWLGKNLPSGASVIIFPSTSLPARNLNVIEIKYPGDYFLAEMQNEGIEWAVFNLEWAGNFYYWWMSQDINTSLKFWNKPVGLLSNTSSAKSLWELKDFIAFEILNPKQAPDSNFFVVKIPPKISLKFSKIIYQENFDMPAWFSINDGFGSLENFTWDKNVGSHKGGSLKIVKSGQGVYSQRFVSPKIPVLEGSAYKISSMMRSGMELSFDKREGFIGANFLSFQNEVIKTSLSERIWGKDSWMPREIVTVAPRGAKYLELFFQTGTFNSNIWLDDVKVWESEERSKR